MGRLALGIDVGGTKIAAAAVEPATGVIIGRVTVPTGYERGPEAVLGDTERVARQLVSAAGELGREIGSVGVGVAELVDPAGWVTSAHHIDWRDVDLAGRLSAIAPATVEADVRAAAAGEVAFGAARDARVVVYVTVGTGISSCLVVDGTPFPGAHGGALVLASGPQTVICSHCGKRHTQVVENLASGPALAGRYAEATSDAVEGAEAVLAAAEGGDEVAQRVIDEGALALGVSVGWLVNVLDPEIVVVGGGLGVAGGRYWQQFVDATRAHIWDENSREVPIVSAALGADSGVIGAAVIGWRAPQNGNRGQIS